MSMVNILWREFVEQFTFEMIIICVQLQDDAYEPIVDVIEMHKKALFHDRLAKLCNVIVVDSSGKCVHWLLAF